MPATIHVPSYLRFTTGEIERVEVMGNTVEECLAALVKMFPDVKDKLFDVDGETTIIKTIPITTIILSLLINITTNGKYQF